MGLYGLISGFLGRSWVDYSQALSVLSMPLGGHVEFVSL